MTNTTAGQQFIQVASIFGGYLNVNAVAYIMPIAPDGNLRAQLTCGGQILLTQDEANKVMGIAPVEPTPSALEILADLKVGATTLGAYVNVTKTFDDSLPPQASRPRRAPESLGDETKRQQGRHKETCK